MLTVTVFKKNQTNQQTKRQNNKPTESQQKDFDCRKKQFEFQEK